MCIKSLFANTYENAFVAHAFVADAFVAHA
jgi:hypothetical protein